MRSAVEPLLAHVISAASQIVAPTDIFVVIGHEAERVKAAVASTGVNFILQAEQKGTGHAIQVAEPAVKGYENLLVLSGDAPLIRPETIAQLRDFHLEQRAAMTILTAIPESPVGYGRVLRKAADQPEVSAIVEQKALTPEQQGAREINSGIYAFASAPLFAHLSGAPNQQRPWRVLPHGHGSAPGSCQGTSRSGSSRGGDRSSRCQHDCGDDGPGRGAKSRQRHGD